MRVHYDTALSEDRSPEALRWNELSALYDLYTRDQFTPQDPAPFSPPARLPLPAASPLLLPPPLEDIDTKSREGYTVETTYVEISKGGSETGRGSGENLKPDELIVRDSKFLDVDGNIDWDTWAPNGGRVPGTVKRGQTLEVGTIIDRYGSPYGKYTSPVGVLI